jgi:hypothetical protein
MAKRTNRVAWGLVVVVALVLVEAGCYYVWWLYGALNAMVLHEDAAPASQSATPPASTRSGTGR